MLGFLKRKVREIYSPVDGETLSLDKVDDEVFSKGLVGDGVAIIPISDIFKSPIDGVITKIFSTNHAFTIKSDKDLTVMVHIGLETVYLDGKGFERLAKEGDEVKVGDAIIKVDLNYIKKHAKDTITPIIISDDSNYKDIKKRINIVKSEDIIMEVK